MKVFILVVNLPVTLIVAAVSFYLQLAECIKLCTWFLKTQCIAMERFRFEVARILRRLTHDLIGHLLYGQEFITVKTLFIDNPMKGEFTLEDDDSSCTCEIITEEPTEEPPCAYTITLESASIGRRLSRRRTNMVPARDG